MPNAVRYSFFEVLTITSSSAVFSARQLPWAQPPRQVVCDLLNRLLAREPEVPALLAEHAGQTFRLIARPVDSALTIAHDGALSASDPAVVPDVTLTIDTQQLWASGWRPGEPIPERPGLVQVSGDAALAQTLSMLAKSWRADPQDLLSSVVGDIPAVQLVASAKRVMALGAQFVGRTSENLAEYAVHEAHLLAGQPNQNAFEANLSNLRQQLESVDARIQSLSEHLSLQEQHLPGDSR